MNEHSPLAAQGLPAVDMDFRAIKASAGFWGHYLHSLTENTSGRNVCVLAWALKYGNFTIQYVALEDISEDIKWSSVTLICIL